MASKEKKVRYTKKDDESKCAIVLVITLPLIAALIIIMEALSEA